MHHTVLGVGYVVYFKQAAVHSVKFSVCSGYSAIYSLKYTGGSVQHAECAVCCI